MDVIVLALIFATVGLTVGLGARSANSCANLQILYGPRSILDVYFAWPRVTYANIECERSNTCTHTTIGIWCANS
jgi:hypothetical protein